MVDPWSIGPQPVYQTWGNAEDTKFPAPSNLTNTRFNFHQSRVKILREWGAKREEQMQRPPSWCMDQLVSGSGLFPPRLLDDSWFTKEELDMITSLQNVLADTGSAQVLARDMMALRIYNVDVRIVCDDSGSMNLSMLPGSRSQQWSRGEMELVFGKRAFMPDSVGAFASSPFPPSVTRWKLLQDAVNKWDMVFKILGVQPKVYLLNQAIGRNSGFSSLSTMTPRGGTPMGRVFQNVLREYKAETKGDPMLLLALTDGEASDKAIFNNVLDQIQDGYYGDVQVCLLGLSLQPEDIEWFEDEECDDTRIRTIEAYEVEQQQILWRKVIQRSTDYNFSMHTFRALVTNFFPADYDYEAPVQTLRHRLYITLHALDRRITGCRDNTYSQGDDLDDLCSCFLGLLCGNSKARQPQLKADDQKIEAEGLMGDDDALIGGFIESLKQQILATEGPRPQIRQDFLNLFQRAIGALQPSELQMRDLQYSDANENRRVLVKALALLRRAAQRGAI